jgi:hypothetical protein
VELRVLGLGQRSIRTWSNDQARHTDRQGVVMRYTATGQIKITVRRKGRKVGMIKRLRFERGPEVVGWANYKNRIYPLFSDGQGGLYLEVTGWTATNQRPLRRYPNDERLWKGGF